MSTDSPARRKERGAFFTPPSIADFLARWAIGDDSRARVLDPTCGDGVFLLAAAARLRELGASAGDLSAQVVGVDLHPPSLNDAAELLRDDGLDAKLLAADFFAVSPGQLAPVDAVIGNPPFVRYQVHAGEVRERSREAALRQGVRLSGLASSWAALLIHACGFLKPGGRLAMVLPAELLTVHYAEPVRRWLRERFAAVHLVMFERLQFGDALERVVLVIAEGEGGCDAFSLYDIEDASELATLGPFPHSNVTPASEGKWTDLLLSIRHRQLFRRVSESHFVSLVEYGSPELGTVTGSNDYFTMTEHTRLEYGLDPAQLLPISPPGTRHLRGLSFTTAHWSELRDAGERVWLLHPDAADRHAGLARYVSYGEALRINEAYKCRIRSPWWRPPAVTPPDLFFTYMSHRYPRLITNNARTTFVNSMHGVRLRPSAPRVSRTALPLLSLNSLSMLGAEVFGRSYGGGVLKMEPREAGTLPVPSSSILERTWKLISPERASLDRQLRAGRWERVVEHVDEALLCATIGLSREEAVMLREAAHGLRARRLGGNDQPSDAD